MLWIQANVLQQLSWFVALFIPLQQPFIEVKILNSPKRSRRDSGLNCDEESAETRCCRYPLTVDFEEFGWDWIIAPKRYRANYCSGECEFLHLQQYPHAHLVNKANPRGTAGPCCTPTKMSPINMLYFNRKEQIIYGKIPSMVVDHCGCSWRNPAGHWNFQTQWEKEITICQKQKTNNRSWQKKPKTKQKFTLICFL